MTDLNIPGIYVSNCILLPFVGSLLGELHATIPTVVCNQKFLDTVLSFDHRRVEGIWQDYLKHSDSFTINDSFKQKLTKETRLDNLPSIVYYHSTCQVPVCLTMDISVPHICGVENKSPHIWDQPEEEVLERINNTSNAPMYTVTLQ
jgi:hypothetical protein